MNMTGRVERLEQKTSTKKTVWLTLHNDDDPKEAIAKYERDKGVRLDPASVRWVHIETIDLG